MFAEGGREGGREGREGRGREGGVGERERERHASSGEPKVLNLDLIPQRIQLVKACVTQEPTKSSVQQSLENWLSEHPTDVALNPKFWIRVSGVKKSW